MGFVETEGIVLRKYNLSDADRIVVVLTEKRGLIRGVANGAKRLKSKFSSSLEFFSRIHLNYFEKEDRELVSIRSTDLVESVFGKLSNPQFYDAFAEIADLLLRFTPANEPNQRLYHMTRHCLKAGLEKEEAIPGVRAYFEIWLLKLGGFLPDWDRCRGCSDEIAEIGLSTLHLDFQAVCEKCGTGTGEQIDSGVRFLFRLAQNKSPAKFAAVAAENLDELRVLANIIGRLSDAVLERAPIAGITAEAKN